MRHKKQKVFLLNFFLLALSILTIIPFIWMLTSSLKTNAEISAVQQHFFPKAPSLVNYGNVLQKMNFFRYFSNTICYAIPISIITVYSSTISGFVLSKYRFRGRNILFSAILATMMVPGVVTIIPKYSLMRWLGWLDTYQSLIIPSLFTSFGIFLMKQSAEAVPDELLDAARIDGSNEFYIFHRIVLPLLRNAISSLVIFQFLWAWEDYLWPYLMIRSQNKQLVSIALQMFSGRFSTNYINLFATTNITIIPIIIVYLIFQKRFIEGIASSAIKG